MIGYVAGTVTTTIDYDTVCFSEPICSRCEQPSEDPICPACRRQIARWQREELFEFIAIRTREASLLAVEHWCHAHRIGRAPDFPSGEV